MVMECKDPAIIYIGYYGSSCRGDARSRGISRYGVGLVNRRYSGSVISRVNIRHYGPGKSQHICLLEGTVSRLEKKALVHVTINRKANVSKSCFVVISYQLYWKMINKTDIYIMSKNRCILCIVWRNRDKWFYMTTSWQENWPNHYL